MTEGATAHLHVVLQIGGSLAGTVYGRHGPVGGACIVAENGGGAAAEAESNRTGGYSVIGLAPGDYLAVAVGCGTRAPASLAPAVAPGLVRVEAGRATTGDDLYFAPGGIITGTVRAADGAPVGGVCVVSADLRTGFGVGAVTNRFGHYRLRGLAAGSDVVGYDLGPTVSCEGLDFLWTPQFFGGGTDLQAAQPVTVLSGATTTGVDAMLQRDGSVSGTVTDGSGSPLPGICAVAVNGHSSALAPVITSSEADGRYEIAGLAAGQYQVGFSTGCGNAGAYAPKWWLDGATQSQASPVAVGSGTQTGGIDVSLSP